MNRFIPFLFLFFSLFIQGCFVAPDPCDKILPGPYHFGTIEAEFTPSQSVLHIGDTLHVFASIPRTLTDTISGDEVAINGGIAILNMITDSDAPDNRIDVDYFATGNTIFEEFDQHFDVEVIRGKLLNDYVFNAKKTPTAWEWEVRYIIKKTGRYWAKIDAIRIYPNVNSEEQVCIDDHPGNLRARLVWKTHPDNKAGEIFQASGEDYPEYFGFVVE